MTSLASIPSRCFQRCRLLPFSSARFIKMKANKHWNPFFKRGRQIKIPDFGLEGHEKDQSIVKKARRLTEMTDPKEREKTQEEIRSILKARGIPPFRPWTKERPYYMSSTGQVLDPYRPPGDEAKTGVVDRLKFLPSKTLDAGKSGIRQVQAQRQIRKHDSDFDQSTFGEEAKQIFIDAHHALMNRDENALHLYVTEGLFPKLWNELKLKTLKWEWVESLAPPEILQLRVGQPSQSSLSLFGQVTVALRSKQILAIYDQFGHLMLGHPDIPQDVVDYVVLEKDLTDQYGRWRLLEKLQSSSGKKQAVATTFRKEMEREIVEFSEEEQKLDAVHIEGDDETKEQAKAS